ncbi:hypothetical protein I6F09_25205 [Bradyrhizobium sp. IC3195]|uniref:phosphoribosyltransferase family protein n=1 Tax=Bradyrhizobium sp. IC3195 TaxID=2793804 RepID=UPI001CD2F467|nr:phosphoribosyltransferase family protein [Bradyrhizobium sp. IC3195]MCA1471166.1 hypothetical protein [Bradyrhizobium sp. IC3195]
MSKTELIDTILTYVPATRRLDPQARENLQSMSEGELSSLAQEVADAAEFARAVLRDERDEAATKKVISEGAVRLRSARASFAEANRLLRDRRTRATVAAEAPVVVSVERTSEASLPQGWEVPFAPSTETISAHMTAAQISEELITNASKQLGIFLVESLFDIEKRLGEPGAFGEQFRKFLQTASATDFMQEFLHARTTSMLLEAWALLLERRSREADPETLALEATFMSVLGKVRNDIVHRPAIYDPHLLAEHEDVVTETRAIDGLALLGIRLLDYKPDLVVSLDRGGQVVGRLLEAQFKSDLGFKYASVARSGGWHMSEEPRVSKVANRILIVDDIARSGEAIAGACEFVKAKYPAAEVRAMVVVGTAPAKHRLRETLYMPNLALNPTVRVPWNSKGTMTFKRVRNGYVLGAKETLEVSRDMFERVIKRFQAALSR